MQLFNTKTRNVRKLLFFRPLNMLNLLYMYMCNSRSNAMLLSMLAGRKSYTVEESKQESLTSI